MINIDISTDLFDMFRLVNIGRIDWFPFAKIDYYMLGVQI